jgi:hypothetical protein
MCQLHASEDKAANMRSTRAALAEAAQKGAQLVILPGVSVLGPPLLCAIFFVTCVCVGVGLQGGRVWGAAAA